MVVMHVLNVLNFRHVFLIARVHGMNLDPVTTRRGQGDGTTLSSTEVRAAVVPMEAK